MIRTTLTEKIYVNHTEGEMDMNNNMEDKLYKKLKMAIIFARMYGVKETLEALPYISHEEMIAMIIQRTDEYLNTNEKDIVRFFECRF